MKLVIPFLLGSACLSLGLVQVAHAADNAYVVSYFEATPAAKDQAADMARRLAKLSRKDAGSVRFEVLQRIGYPDQFAVVEVWEDVKAQEAHGNAAHTQLFREKLKPLLRAPYDERPHIVLSVGSATAAGAKGAIYAVTHIVYTLNDYGTYRLRPGWLPQEFAFLKANVTSACKRNDPEILGELLDSLKAFGLRANHPLIIRGTKYLLEEQNEDGSWGDTHEKNIRTRCHTTWTAIDGLRTYAWRGERCLNGPELKSILKR